jgi:hypothetical protein
VETTIVEVDVPLLMIILEELKHALCRFVRPSCLASGGNDSSDRRGKSHRITRVWEERSELLRGSLHISVAGRVVWWADVLPGANTKGIYIQTGA